MKITMESNFLNKFKKPDKIKNAQTKIAFDVLNNIRSKTPVVSGALKMSESFSIMNESVSWGAKVTYAAEIEDRHHFLRDGISEKQNLIMTELEKAFRENLK